MAAGISWFEPSLLTDGFGGLLLQAAPDAPARGLGYDLTSVLVFSLFGIAFVVVTVSILSRLLRPRARPESEPAKMDTYECGEPAIGSSWVRFDIRFYMVALIFLIFDVEVAFLYPWAVIFKQFRQYEVAGLGRFIFIEMLIFIAILLVGFIYCWKKGDLDWVKSLQSQARSGKPPPSVDEVPHETVPVEGPQRPALAESH